jgi:molybdate transport system substrate-binding protein
VQPHLRRILIGSVAGALLLSAAAAQVPRDGTNVFPPWQHGRNNDSIDRGFEFTVPQVDVLADFHGDPFNAKLVLYVGGNYFFAMAPLVEDFETSHPELNIRSPEALRIFEGYGFKPYEQS